jgi:hypothetical protein
MTTRNTGTPQPPACVDCGAPATVEALRVGAGNELLSDVAACAEHAGPYLADATDVIDLHPSTLPTTAAGPVPAVNDRVQVDGRAWEVWDIHLTPAGGHEVVLFAENLDDDTRWHAPGSVTTVAWQPTDAEPAGPVTRQATAVADQAEPPVIDSTGRADLAQIYTWVPTPAEQDAIDWARAHADDLGLLGPSPKQALDVADEAHQLALDDTDDLTADQAPDAADLADTADLDLTDTADLGL